MSDTPRIRARFHDSAVSRVTRMYAATLADIFAETLQNARRAGATRVRVSISGPQDRPIVTVADDGAGIARSGRPAVVRRERLGQRAGAPRGRRGHGHAEPRAARLHRFLPTPVTQR